MEYIDKAAVVAEIDRRMQELRPTNTHKMQVGEKMDRDVLMWLNALTWVKKVINTLVAKEIKEEPVNIDFEQELYKAFGHVKDFTLCLKIARRFYEMGRNYQEPVSERFAFKAIPRLLEMIEPTDRAKAYIAKLADTLELEGYSTDAKIVRESLKIMNGEKVAMATMDEEPVSEEIEVSYDAKINEAHRLGREEGMFLAKTMFKEPVSEDLEKASKEWLAPQLDKSYANYGEAKMMELTHFDGYAMLDAIEFGAKWMKAKDQSTTEDLGEYINELSKQFPEVSFAKLSRIAVRVAKWQKENLWKPADGEDLPEIDREVIVLTQDFPNDAGIMKVAIAHRPNPKGFDGKSLLTGKVEHYTPMTYGKGCWNIPDVRFWLDVDIPNLEED